MMYLNRMRRILSISLFVLIHTALAGQIPANPLGLQPARMKWNQINTGKVQVIFPRGLEQQGVRVASLAEYMYDHHNEGIGDHQKKIQIYLYNLNAIANAQVTVAPFRSEFFLRPPQMASLNDWTDELVAHEYQHVKQFANSDQGITHLAKSIFGSWVWGGFAATAMPRWFWEGDAVGAETGMTRYGRGREASFLMEYRTMRQEGAHFGYEKAGAQSFRDPIPNWYHLGYLMTTNARRQYGETIWEGVVQDAVRYRGLLYPFSRSLRKTSGYSTRKWYAQTMQYVDSLWAVPTQPEYLESRAVTDMVITARKPRKVINYTNPHYLGNGAIVCLEAGYDRIASLVQLQPDGHWQPIKKVGILPENPYDVIDVTGNQICWSNYAVHPRWEYVSYNNLHVFNSQTKSGKKLTGKERIASPAIAPDALHVAVIALDSQIRYQVQLLDMTNGQVVQSYPNPKQVQYRFLAWQGDDLCAVIQHRNREGIVRLRENGRVDTLLGLQTYALGQMTADQNRLFFTAGLNGIQNVYAIYRDRPGIYQVTFSTTGAFQPDLHPDGNKLLYSEYHYRGFEVHELELHGAGKRINWPAQYTDPLVSTVADQYGDLTEKVPNKAYDITPIHKGAHMIRVHSFFPTVDPPVYGASLLSDDGFGTLSGELGAYYNANEERWSALANFTYGGWYPLINASFSQANRRSSFYQFQTPNDTTLLTNFYSESWQEQRISTGVTLPFSAITGPMIHNASLTGRLIHIQNQVGTAVDNPANNRDTFYLSTAGIQRFRTIEKPPLADGSLWASRVQFTYSMFQQRARQQVLPRMGGYVQVNWQHSLNTTWQGDFFTVDGGIWLPGIARTHGIRLRTTYRQEDLLNNYSFSDLFGYSRGYGAPANDRILGFSVDYALPLAYPDLALGPIAFIQRIKGNVFYDYNRVKLNFPFDAVHPMRSIGADVRFDVRFLRLLDVDMGFRYSYLLDERYVGNSPHQFQFLLFGISG